MITMKRIMIILKMKTSNSSMKRDMIMKQWSESGILTRQYSIMKDNEKVENSNKPDDRIMKIMKNINNNIKQRK
jgi:hypothetical protein